jgi:alpha-glucosidase
MIMAVSPWWHGAVLYQLYVRSWRDSDGDGYGDIRGILAGLDHLSWLGVDGVWLSPTMPSPDEDWGYDVSDYTGVHPELGTSADLDALIAAAAGRGIRVLLDLVPNHTSSAHPWFIDAAASRDSTHRDYYVWADAAPGGGPPNNWLDATGHSAWQWDATTGQYYLHNFLVGQPDLNWWLPAVHAEFRDILEFWFDRGVAGFRIDVAHGLYKDAELRDNPPLPPGTAETDGRFGLRPVYNANRPETHGVYRDWRKIADSYSPPRLLLGETWVSDAARLASYYGSNDELQLAFNFPFAFAHFEMPDIARVISSTLAALPPGACPVWMASNHDISRFPSRWCHGDERLIRLALLMLTTLPGTTVLYYGDEIGMTDVDVPPELQRDAMTRGASARPNRDRARSPMRWDDSAGAGFTAGDVRPWLPLPPSSAPNVAAQRADAGSILWFCKQLIAMRRAEIGAEVVGLELLPGPAGLLAYQVGQLVVAANLSADPAELPARAGQVLLDTARGPQQALHRPTRRQPAVLRPWQGIVARRSADPS